MTIEEQIAELTTATTNLLAAVNEVLSGNVSVDLSGLVPLDEFGKVASQYLNIVNDLVSGGNTSLASAETVKTLKNQIDAINLLLSSNDVNLDTVQEIVTAIKTVQTSLSTILVNDLTTGGTTKALTAEQGKILKGLIDDLPAPVSILGLATETYVNNALNNFLLLQVETRLFYNNTLISGGIINQKDLLAIDKFIVNGKAHGWWDAQRDMCLYLKTKGGINSSIIKLKNYANKPIINHNYLDENVTLYGIQAPPDVWNTSKYLDLNVSMVDLGIDLQNLSATIFTPYEGSGDNRFGQGNNNNGLGAALSLFKDSSTFIPFNMARNGGDTVGTYGTSNQSIGVNLITGRSDGITSFCNGVNYLDTASAGSGVLEGTFETSRGLYDSTNIYYGDIPLSFYSLGTSLTNEQALYLSKDLYELMDDLGRVAKVNGLASFGDSILKGFVTPLFKTYAHLVANSLGLNDLNMSRGERMTSASAGDVLPALDLIKQVTAFAPKGSTVMFGLGTNDILSLDSNTNDFGDPTKLSTYTNYCNAMLETIRISPMNLIVVSIGYMEVDLVNISVNKQLDYVKVSASLAKDIYKLPKRMDIHFINLYHFLLDSDVDYSLGGVHFTDAGNKSVAEEVVRIVKTGVQRRNTSLAFGTIIAGASVDINVTVLNAEIGMSTSVTPPNNLLPGLVLTSFVSANDTVVVRLTNVTGSSITALSGKFIVDVKTEY